MIQIRTTAHGIACLLVAAIAWIALSFIFARWSIAILRQQQNRAFLAHQLRQETQHCSDWPSCRQKNQRSSYRQAQGDRGGLPVGMFDCTHNGFNCTQEVRNHG